MAPELPPRKAEYSKDELEKLLGRELARVHPSAVRGIQGVRIPCAPLADIWLDPARWKIEFSAKWETPLHCTEGESRAVVAVARHLARSRNAWGKKVLIFSDSMTAIGALGKGRSSAFKILRQCRRMAAVTLSTGIIVKLRYVPSQVNFADGPSRGLRHAGVDAKTVAAHLDRRLQLHLPSRRKVGRGFS
jgi:hypothetical protein